MPDRELTAEELKKFVMEHCATREMFHALLVFKEEKSKPSLHDLCISELDAKCEALTRIVIAQGRDLLQIRTRLSLLENQKHE